MKRHFPTPMLIIGLCALWLSACNTPTAVPTAVPPTPTEVPPTSTPVPTPTAPPTATVTATPRPTNTPVPTPTLDLSNATLILNDLPPGFEALSEADLTRLHVTQSEFATGMEQAFSGTRLQNYVAFLNGKPQEFQIIIAFVVYPLSPLQKAQTDLELSDPQSLAQGFAQSFSKGSGVKSTTAILPGMDKIGDKSAGFAVISEGKVLRTEGGMVRRGAVLEVIFTLYRNGTRPTIGIVEIARRLDAHVAALLRAG